MSFCFLFFLCFAALRLNIQRTYDEGGGLNYVCWWLGEKSTKLHVCLGLHARGEGGVVWRSAVEWHAMIAAVRKL
jgi:hypothetical protein